MLRTIVQPADLGGAALGEFKDWLGITRSGEDALLTDLLGASLAMCEAFTGQSPLEQRIEERLPPRAGRQVLTSRPVRMLLSAELIDPGGVRVSIAGEGHGFVIDASGVAEAELKRDFTGQAIALQMIVGIAPDWAALPRALRHGIIRLGAHYYRDRDHQGTSQPPASVTALWRPWRAVRLT